MSAWREKLRRATRGLGTAMYTGALAFVSGRLLADDGPHPLALALLGALYAAAVLGLVRVSGARRWGLAVAGLVAGPVPVALLASADTPADQRGGLLFVGALLGLLVGLLEWNREVRALRADAERAHEA